MPRTRQQLSNSSLSYSSKRKHDDQKQTISYGYKRAKAEHNMFTGDGDNHDLQSDDRSVSSTSEDIVDASSPEPVRRIKISKKEKSHRKYGTACGFCRKRKMRCDAATPRCSNCKSHAQECSYVHPAKLPRPTHARIQFLESEVERLQSLLQQANNMVSCKPEPSRSATPLMQVESRARSVSEVSETFPDDLDMQGRGNAFHNFGIGIPPAPVFGLYGQPESVGSSNADLSLPISPGGDLSQTLSSPTLSITPLAGTKRMVQGSTGSSFNPILMDDFLEFESQDTYRLSSSARPSSISIPMDTPFIHPRVYNSEQDIGFDKTMRRPITYGFLPVQGGQEATQTYSSLDCDIWPSHAVKATLTQYFDQPHPLSFMICRSLFMRDMACAGPYFSRLLLNAMLLSAIEFSGSSESTDPHTFGRKSIYNRLQVLLAGSTLESDIPTVCAMLLVANTAIEQALDIPLGFGGRSFFEIAMCMVAELQNTYRDDRCLLQISETKEACWRVVWSAYLLDKLHGLYLNRPALLAFSDVRQPLVFDMPSSNLLPSFACQEEHADRHRPSETLQQFCKLGRIMEDLLASIANTVLSAVPPDQQESQRRFRLLDERLRGWYHALPSYLKLGSPQDLIPMGHTLRAIYNTTLLSLHKFAIESPHLMLTGQSRTASLELVNDVIFSLSVQKTRLEYQTLPFISVYSAYLTGTVLDRVLTTAQTAGFAASLWKHNLNIIYEVLTSHSGLYKKVPSMLRLLTNLTGSSDLNRTIDLKRPGLQSLSNIAPSFVTSTQTVASIALPLSIHYGYEGNDMLKHEQSKRPVVDGQQSPANHPSLLWGRPTPLPTSNHPDQAQWNKSLYLGSPFGTANNTQKPHCLLSASIPCATISSYGGFLNVDLDNELGLDLSPAA